MSTLDDISINVEVNAEPAAKGFGKIAELATNAGKAAGKAVQDGLVKGASGMGQKLDAELGKAVGGSLKAATSVAAKATEKAFQAADAAAKNAADQLTGAKAQAEAASKHLDEARKNHEKLKAAGTSGDALQRSALELGKAAREAASAQTTLKAATEGLESAQDAAAEASRRHVAALGGQLPLADKLSIAFTDAGKAMTTMGPKLTSAGSAISSIGDKLTGAITKPALAAASAVGGIFAVGGWNRLMAIDTAKAKLKGLGHDAAGVDLIMENALASVKGTAFGLGDAASVAASAVAAGIKPGADLERTLKLTADAAAIAGIEFSDMGGIINKVATTNKLSGEVIEQMSERGIAVLPALAEHLGITAAEVSKLASEGKIDFETFQAAMEGVLGGAAGIMGAESLAAAMKNVWASVGRVGAAFLDAGGTGGGFFSQLKPIMAEVTGMVDDLAPAAETLGIKFGSAFAYAVEKARGVLDFLRELDPGVWKVVGAIAGVAVAAGPVIGAVGKITTAVGFLSTKLGPVLQAAGALMSGAGLGGLTGAAATAGKALSFMAGPVGIILSLVSALIAASPELRATLGAVFQQLMGVVGELAGVLMDALGPLLSTLMGALGPVLTMLGDLLATVLAALMPLIEALGPILTPIIRLVAAILEPLVALLAALLPPIIAVVEVVVDALAGAFGALAPILADVVLMLFKMSPAMLLILPALEWLAAAIPVVVQWFKDLFDTGTETGAGFADIWSGVAASFEDVWGGIASFFTGLWGGIVDFFQGIWSGVAAVFGWVWSSVIKPIVDAIAWYITELLIPAYTLLWNTVSWVFTAISTAAQIFWAALKYVFDLVVGAVTSFLAPIFEWLNGVILAAWNGIVAGVTYAWGLVSAVFTAINNAVRFVVAAVFTWLRDNVILPIWNAIVVAITTAWAFISGIFTAINDAIRGALAAVFLWLRDNVIMPVWNGIRSAIDTVYNWFQGTLVPAFERALAVIGSAFEALKTTIGEAWENIKKAAMAPVKFVVESVYRDGIKSLFDDIAEAVGLDLRMPDPPSLSFRSGGVLPGYTPGVDVHRFYSPTGGLLDLSGGEGIIRPDALRGLGGKRWLDQVNRLGIHAGAAHQRFADGGVWEAIGGTISGAKDWLSNTVGALGQIIVDPLGAIDRLIGEPVRQMLSGMGGGHFGTMLAEMPGKWIEGVKDWFSSMLIPTTQGVNGQWTGGAALARVQSMLPSFPGLFITDTYRDPAYNAAVGGSPTSFHMDAANPAVDIAGPFAQMDAFARMAYSMPAGTWRQILWLVAGHYDHVHVANRGGVMGQLPSVPLFDAGGWFEPGLAVNKTGKPEAVFTAEQWETLRALALRGGSGLPETVTLVDADGTFLARMQTVATDTSILAIKEVMG